MNDKLTNFGEDTTFGKDVDEKIQSYYDDASNIATKIQDEQQAKGDDTSSALEKINAKYKTKSDSYLEDIDNINSQFASDSAERREQSEQLVNNITGAAGLEANISAARANQGGRLSVGQLSSINKDITNQFATSMNNAQKDNINFQLSLDTKLAEFGLSVIDKKRLIDAFTKSLEDSEAAPLIDAIAEKATTKIEFLKGVGEVIKKINQTKTDEAVNRGLREDRVEAEEQAFNAMTPEGRERYVRDKFGATWNVLSDGQKNELIQRAVSGNASVSELNDIIENLKDRNEQAKIIQQQAAAGSEENANRALDETGIPFNAPNTFTSGTAYEEPTGGDFSVAGYNFPTQESADGFKAFVLKNSGYLSGLKQSDPERFKTVIDNIRQKYNGEQNKTSSSSNTSSKSNTSKTTASSTKKVSNQTTSSANRTEDRPDTNQSSNQGYTKGSYTFADESAYNKAVDYLKKNQTAIRTLQQNDPAKYQVFLDAWKKKYTI